MMPLHQLPVQQRIKYKLAMITYKMKLSGIPAYLTSLLVSYSLAWSL